MKVNKKGGDSLSLSHTQNMWDTAMLYNQGVGKDNTYQTLPHG